MSIKQSSRRTIRRLSLGLAVLVGSLALTGTSHAQAAVYEFQPVSLHVKDVEDWGWGLVWDEPRLYYNGKMVWASMVYNTEYVEGSKLPTTRFSSPSSLVIDLLEVDGDGSNYNLGRTRVSSYSAYGAAHTFGGGWAGYEYELTYNVVQVG